jgi:hypothetical protein
MQRRNGHIQAKRERNSRRKGCGFFQRLKPVMEALLGQLEIPLLTGMEAYPGELQEEEWDDVTCPAIVRMIVNKQELFARALMGDVHTWDQWTKLAFIKI